jgi:hypothetical protein
MTSRILAILIVFAFLAASPALAVKKVPKQSAQQSTSATQGQNQTGGQKESGDIKQNVQPPPPQQPQSRRPEPPKIKEKDRFIDENDDGINDRYKKPPVVKKKPKEEGSRENKGTRRSRRPR